MITSFSNYLTYNRGLSENTAKAYADALKDFARFINEQHKGTSWRTVTKTMIDEYVVNMVADGSAPATVKLHISALRTFYKTCIVLGCDIQNPAKYVSTPKLGKQLPKVIETEAIKMALSSSGVSAQAKACIAIIYETGIRLQELLDLRAEDVCAASQSIKIHGKGNKERTVYYGELTKRYGRCWDGTKFTQRAVRHMVYEALRPFSQAKQLSPHAIRHTFATTMLNNGASLETIGKLLGHEHSETTEVYAQLTNQTTQQLYLQFQPTLQ